MRYPVTILLLESCPVGPSTSGKSLDFDSSIRRFESYRASQIFLAERQTVRRALGKRLKPNVNDLVRLIQFTIQRRYSELLGVTRVGYFWLPRGYHPR